MSTRPPLTDEVRHEAFEYVDAVLARSKGAGPETSLDIMLGGGGRPLLSRLVPAPVKRATVRLLVYVMRHPFDHLAHPMRRQIEEEIGQARGVAHAALTRAEHTQAEVRRLRAEVKRHRPSS